MKQQLDISFSVRVEQNNFSRVSIAFVLMQTFLNWYISLFEIDNFLKLQRFAFLTLQQGWEISQEEEPFIYVQLIVKFSRFFQIT